MPRKQKKYHVIYKTTCKVNGKYYIGMHSTDNLDDGYLGSGTHLRRSIRKYGTENFEFYILEFVDTKDELRNREEEIINEYMLHDPMCMNLTIGGGGGWYHVNSKSDIQRAKAIKSNARQKVLKETDPAWVEKKYKNQSVSQQKCYDEGREKTYFHDWNGKLHSEESKKKMGETKRKLGTHKGHKNSQYGTCWIYSVSLKQNKKIKKEELNEYMELGWTKGMRPEYNKK